MKEISPPVKPFEVICISCVKVSNETMTPYKGLVNHDYMVISPYIILIRYRCFTCGSTFSLEVNGLKSEMQSPKDKQDLKKKMGYKEEVDKN